MKTRLRIPILFRHYMSSDKSALQSIVKKKNSPNKLSIVLRYFATLQRYPPPMIIQYSYLKIASNTLDIYTPETNLCI